MCTCLFSAFLTAGVASAQSPRDGFDPTANGAVHALAVQADGKILAGGEFTQMGASAQTRNRLARLDSSGSLDAAFNPNVDGVVYALAVQTDGKILIGGAFTQIGGQARSRLARISDAGVLDVAFAPSANGVVHALTALEDGKILVAGAFTGIGGQPTAYLARLDSNGAVETTFAPTLNGAVYAVAVQRDGSIIIGGAFTQVEDQTRRHIARLNANGALDPDFNPDANDVVRAVGIQFGGKLVIGGDFTQVGGQMRSYLARVNAAGSMGAAPALEVNAPVRALLVLSDDRFLAGGEFTQMGGQPFSGLARFARDGSPDPTFAPNPDAAVHALVEQMDGKVVIGGAFLEVGGIKRWRLARLYADGGLDADFAPTSAAGGADASIKALAIQPDGKILLGGAFTTINGQARHYLARLLPDGALDPTFTPSANQAVWAIAVQPDGKIVAAGGFSEVNGEAHHNIVRLETNGAIDPTFVAMADQYVLTLALQPDGKLILGGDFTRVNGQVRKGLTRLNYDGSLDPTFAADTEGRIITLVLQPDGKLLVGGEFGKADGAGQLHDNLMRLNADGAIDATFTATADNVVLALALQADERILVGGQFSSINGAARNGASRLNVDGALDATFDPNVGNVNGFIYAISIQADGQIILAGNFRVIGGQIRNRIARFSADGQLDARFDPNVNAAIEHGVVFATALQQDGKVVIAGAFTDVGGAARTNLARLSNNQAAGQWLTPQPNISAVIWRQDGAAPLLARTLFEYSTDGIHYISLGAGARTAAGWQAISELLPFNQEFFIRVRGLFASGGFAASTSMIEKTVRVYMPGSAIEIATTVSPAELTPPWTVALDGPTFLSTTLHGNDTTGRRNIGAGVYTISLTPGAGHTLSDYATTYTCTIDGQPGPSGAGVTAQLTIAVGQTVRCAFANTRRAGSLDVVHSIEPSASSSIWDLRAEGPSSFTAVLAGDAGTGVRSVFTGAYTLSLAQRAAARYTTSYTCTASGQPLVSGEGEQAAFTVAPDQAVVCIFISRDSLLYPPHRLFLPSALR